MLKQAFATTTTLSFAHALRTGWSGQQYEQSHDYQSQETKHSDKTGQQYEQFAQVTDNNSDKIIMIPIAKDWVQIPNYKIAKCSKDDKNDSTKIRDSTKIDI